MENPKRHGKSCNQWLGGKPPSHRGQLCGLIDNALAQKPTGLDMLLRLLQEAGAAMKRRGKGVSLQAPGRDGFIRLSARNMGQEYDLAELLAVLAGEKKHSSGAKNIRHADLPKVNLLADMQAKLQAELQAGNFSNRA